MLPYQAAVILCLPIQPGLIAFARAIGLPGFEQPPTVHEFAASRLHVNLAGMPDLYGRGYADAGYYCSMAVLLQATALTVSGFWPLRRVAPRHPLAPMRGRTLCLPGDLDLVPDRHLTDRTERDVTSIRGSCLGQWHLAAGWLVATAGKSVGRTAAA